MTDIIPSSSTSMRDEELVSRLRILYQYARDDKRPRYDSWSRNYKLIHNKVASSSVGYQVQPKDSEVYPAISSLVAWMTDQNVNIDVTPSLEPSSQNFQFWASLAQDLSTIHHNNWQVEQYGAEVALTIWDAFQFGAGFFKNVWDQSLSGGYGNAMLRRCDPWSLYFDPHATSEKDAEYICEVRRMSIEEIDRRWPGAADKLGRGAVSGEDIDERPVIYGNGSGNQYGGFPGNLPGVGGGSTQWGRVRRTYRQFDPQPSIIVYEFWIKENAELYQGIPDDISQLDDHPVLVDNVILPQWRVIIVADGKILMDELAEDLWSYKSHPYERYCPEDVGELYGVALVDHLANNQVYLNRLLAALQSNAELIGSPILLDGKNSGLERTAITNRPGQRLSVNPHAMINGKPEWMVPPSMPQYIPELAQFWISRMENTTGLRGALKGEIPGQRSSSETISTVQEGAYVRIRMWLRALEWTLSRCAVKLSDLIIDNYDVPRTVAIVGQQGEKNALAINAQHFSVPGDKGRVPFKYALQVECGAAMPTSRQQRMQEADVGLALGTYDRQGWYEAHNTPNWPTMLDRINEAIAKGTFMPPGARQRAGRSQ